MDGLNGENSYYSKAFCAAPAKLQPNTRIITLYDLGKVNTVYITVALATNLVSLLQDLALTCLVLVVRVCVSKALRNRAPTDFFPPQKHGQMH